MKKCRICSLTKKKSNFNKCAANKSSGLHSYCRECQSVNRKKYHLENKDASNFHSKAYYKENKTHLNELCSQWKSDNKDYIRNYNQQYYHDNIDNIQYRLRRNLRIRLYQAIKGNYKAGSAVKDLGCSIEHLIKHLESKFADRMTWDNYGKWHIDHIKPLSKFDLANSSEWAVACNFMNLQPLWAIDNTRKLNG